MSLDLILRIKALSFHSYETPLTTGRMSPGILVHLTDEKGESSWGEAFSLSPPNALAQLEGKRRALMAIGWSAENCLEELRALELLPEVSFSLESALLCLLDPLPAYTVPVSALLMGSLQDILEQAEKRRSEGYSSAKLKVGTLHQQEAKQLIDTLKDTFRLRIDVNRAWSTTDSLRFFSQFPLDTFDYVEEPFQNPHDLARFVHPLAVDESFPRDLSLEQLEMLPTLKALIYKPSLHGGMLHALPLQAWALKRGISLVLSSHFESERGLTQIASLAHRLSLTAPVGIGTYHYLKK